MNRRENKNEVTGEFSSVISEINVFLKELKNMYSKASRDYNEIKRNTDDNGDRVTLENIRANTLKTIENYFKIRLDTLKLLAVVADKMSPKDAAAVKGKLTAEDRNSEDLDKWLNDLRNKKKTNNE
jgi:hypothetical protein